MSNKFKVLVNQTEEINLYKYDLNDVDNDSLNYNIINTNRPIAYHNFCFDSKKYDYISTDRFNLKENKTESLQKKPYLYSNNIKFVHERYNEMCYICSYDLNSSVLIWSWEFDRQIEITELIMNTIFMTLDQGGEINWYISTELSNEINGQLSLEENNIVQLVRDQFIKIPFDLESPVYFDQKVNLTNFVKNSNKLYLACIIDNDEDQNKNQLFRSKYIYNLDQVDQEPLHKPQKHQYPFSMFFNLSLKNDLAFKKPIVQIKENPVYFFREEMDFSYQNIKKNQPIKWDGQRVGDWLFDLGFYELIPRFKANGIDGKKLLENGINNLPDNFIQDLKKRKRYIKSLNQLLQNSNMGTVSVGTYASEGRAERSKYSHQYKDDSILILDTQARIDEQFEKDLETTGFVSLELGDKENSNYKIMVDDKEFFIHKELLSNSSDYFKALFNSNFNENLSGEIIFKEDTDNLTKESLQIVLELTYLHTEENKIDYLKKLSLYQIVTVLKVCDRLFFNGLKNVTEKYVIWNIKYENLKYFNEIFKFNNNIHLFSNFLIKFYNKN
ncbi:hypothetical protein DICPUDRAFT_155432 [Dictyostelium purpureum]|uniref:BTB domain-containing protein n=1 Tax=Dictyostelium purpureum TaxID=5786 RepID=F0ZU02_DICPU|nr:uncharacterized protein DICPUDRAFT_155432 [Dictyostelium purpureum]EGC32559.1 hypothetical protein DICPUDRAFT_155432 [Dictyostelium purpureum]|eukprot:XP_003290896.1 hypothetical protein DICPUDRAFT_155432 [Dictyostelium purpureum]